MTVALLNTFPKVFNRATKIKKETGVVENSTTGQLKAENAQFYLFNSAKFPPPPKKKVCLKTHLKRKNDWFL